MTPEEPKLWWYALDGVQHGPVREDDLLDLRRRGQLGPRSLVWAEGMKEWSPFARTRLHELVPDAPGNGGVDAIEPEDVSLAIILSVITCGIWSFVVFHRTGKAYATHSGHKDNFDGWFWSYVGLVILSIFTGGIAAIVSIPVGAFLLKEVLDHRRAIEGRAQVSPPLTDHQTHIVLWVLGSAFSFVLVGFPVLIYQAVLFLRDHNRLCAARA